MNQHRPANLQTIYDVFSFTVMLPRCESALIKQRITFRAEKISVLNDTIFYSYSKIYYLLTSDI